MDCQRKANERLVIGGYNLEAMVVWRMATVPPVSGVRPARRQCIAI
ncbi:hypothetical protein MY4824_002188 [Beauveria thailandica]